jgi:cell division protein FtsI (penicillin-binding protein 3)
MPRFRTVQKDDTSRSAKRVYAVGAIFACLFGILGSRAIAFHIKDNENLERVALRQYRTAVRDSSRRGKILDAAGREMAIDVTAESIFANPKEIENPVMASEKLSSALEVKRSKLLDKLTSKRKFVWVKRRAEDDEVEKVKGLGLKGIYMMRESRRLYPNGTVGAQVLGAVGYEAEPLGGLELSYDDTLSSKSHSGEVKRDARGHLYLSPADEDGAERLKNIELTIDNTLQYISERALVKGVKAARAEGGEALVVDVKTGAVLAMSNLPTFDPNEYGKYPLTHWRNSAIVEPHEPGSTFKVISTAAALDAGVVKTDEKFDCENGKIKIGDDIVRDSHSHKMLTFADVIKLSSNIGAYKVADRLGRAELYETIRAFGFGRKTGIDLPGETAGILSHHSKWSPVQFVTIAFGQGIAVTSLQMTMAFAAIANGGKLMKPYVVARVNDKAGNTLEETKPEVAGLPIGEKTARTMVGLLKRVVEDGGTGVLAASYEYAVAGKTGTAQKVDYRTGTYADGKYYASFVGFAPANDPRIAVFVGIDEPKGQYYGGQVAAPVFRSIVEQTLHYLKVPATLIAQKDVGEGAGLPPTADMAELPVVVSGDEVDKQVVKHGDEYWRIPDLSGLTMRGVLTASGDADIEWKFMGSGIAVRQIPEAGSLVRAGEKCVVEFRPML